MTGSTTAVLAVQVGDWVTLVALTVLGAVPAVALGLWLTRRGGASATGQLLVLAIVPLLATWVGAIVAARAMFIDSHDLTAFGVIAATAGTVGALTAWRLARRIRSDVEGLTELSRAIASGAVPDPPAGGSVGELRVLGRQLSEMSQRLDAAHRRELTLERSRRELVAWVSHDLRSPLAGIRAMAEALEDGVVSDPDDVGRYLRSIGAETDRVTLLVDDLFELSRITSGTMALTPRPEGVADLVRRVLDGTEPAARARGVGLSSDVAGLPDVLVAPAEATRVLRNLVDNAVRHTPAGGMVEIHAAPDGDGVVLSVRDECGGIPAEDLERVFDVAFRGDAARGREDGGGGLGLAIAKGLAEAQSGTIAVTNQPGGCCFSVRFPTGTPGGRP